MLLHGQDIQAANILNCERCIMNAIKVLQYNTHMFDIVMVCVM